MDPAGSAHLQPLLSCSTLYESEQYPTWQLTRLNRMPPDDYCLLYTDFDSAAEFENAKKNNTISYLKVCTG